MSRVGKKAIAIPAGVKVEVAGQTVHISGKSGKLHKDVHQSLQVKVQGAELQVAVRTEGDQAARALHGLTRTLLANMVHGVVEGYKKELELQGVGYRAQVQGQKLTMQLGFSHPVEFPLPEGVSAKVDANTKITLNSADKELIGLTASRLRRVKPPEPYKGKGVRYLGEHITLKQGKTAGSGK